MPTRIFDTAPHKQMIRSAKAALVASAWTFEDSKDATVDFSGRRQDLVLHFACLDSNNRAYLSNLGQQMQTEASDIRIRTGRPLIWVLDAPLPGVELSHLLPSGLIVFLLNEIGKVSDAAGGSFSPGDIIEPRVKAIIESSMLECIRVSERFEAAGDDASALEWMRHAVNASPGFSGARVKLFELLSRSERLEEADAVGREALMLRPDASALVMAMKRLAIRRNKPEEALMWHDWHSSKCQEFPRTTNFDSISRAVNQNLQLQSDRADIKRQKKRLIPKFLLRIGHRKQVL